MPDITNGTSWLRQFETPDPSRLNKTVRSNSMLATEESRPPEEEEECSGFSGGGAKFNVRRVHCVVSVEDWDDPFQRPERRAPIKGLAGAAVEPTPISSRLSSSRPEAYVPCSETARSWRRPSLINTSPEYSTELVNFPTCCLVSSKDGRLSAPWTPGVGKVTVPLSTKIICCPRHNYRTHVRIIKNKCSR